MHLPDWSPVGVCLIDEPLNYIPIECPQAKKPKIQKLWNFVDGTEGWLIIDHYWNNGVLSCAKPPEGLIIKYYIPFPKHCGRSPYFYPGHWMLKVWKFEDHPNMSLLPEHCPRVVRRLYSKETQLNILRMVDCLWLFEAIREAEKAYDLYNINKKGTIMNEQNAQEVKAPDQAKEETLEQIMEKVVQKPNKEVM